MIKDNILRHYLRPLRKVVNRGSNICYPDTESAEMVAKNSEWMTIGERHYCPNCYELDEETDEYVPKKGGKK